MSGTSGGYSAPSTGGGERIFRVVQALPANTNTVITHNLGGTAPAIVEVRNNNTGALVTHRVIAETVNTVTIRVGAPLAAARITVYS